MVESQPFASVTKGSDGIRYQNHWNKLQERVRRGVGNPCPPVLLGIPSHVVRKSAGM